MTNGLFTAPLVAALAALALGPAFTTDPLPALTPTPTARSGCAENPGNGNWLTVTLANGSKNLCGVISEYDIRDPRPTDSSNWTALDALAAEIAARDCYKWLEIATAEDPTGTHYSCEGVRPGSTMTLLYVNTPDGERVEVEVPPIWLTASDLRSLPIDAGEVWVNGWSGEWLIHFPMPVAATASEHVVTTQVLGIPVEVKVTPLAYAWDGGPGSTPLTTTDPGSDTPGEASVELVWEDVRAEAAVDVTTQWRGEFRVAGTTVWLPINGTTTTTATSQPFDIIEAPARLIANP